MFAKKNLGKLTVDSEITLAQFRTQVFENLIKGRDDLKVKVSTESELRVRNPKNDDLGDVITISGENEGQLLSQFFLFDGKEFLVQKCDEYFVSQCDTEASYSILIREWRPDTWDFGPMYEVQVEKMITCAKLAEFI